MERQADPAHGLGIEPFDYDRANMTDGLWIAEGFTQYYGPLLEERAGVIPPTNVIRGLGFTINNVANSPGRRYFGPIGMSHQAPFRDGAAANDPVSPNIFISYYTYGAAIATAPSTSRCAPGASRSTTSCARCGSTTASPRFRTRCTMPGTP